jgi:hypothetical protein
MPGHFATWGTPMRRRLAAACACLLPLVVTSGCRDNAPDDVFVDEQTTEAIVFVKTAGEETLNRSWAYGNLYKLSPISPDGKVTPITDFEGASVSDPVVSFDGKKILFSMRPPGAANRNIYEIDADGTGLRQITSGGGHDFDPVYLPDGDILFTSSSEMDEYNHSPAEHMYRCHADGTALERISFNQSDDFDPVLLPNGRIMYTRWEHFGTFNRFPLFASNPDGTGIFHHYGPHSRNFFHAQPMPDGRIIAIESTMVNEDAGPIAVLLTEQGPADPVVGSMQRHWNVLNANVNNDGAPWPYGAFKYPFPIGENRYVASYTLPAATEEDVDYGLYTFTLDETGAGTDEDPTQIAMHDLTFLYNDPNTNEYDAQLLAPHEKPPVVAREVDPNVDWGIFTAQDVFNRGTQDGQERPREGIDAITKIAVYAARPTMRGEANDFSANEFEKRALIGFAPVQPDGSFSIRVPADTPLGFATLDDQGRGFVVKRTWLAVRPGEHFSQCTGCHEDRGGANGHVTNPDPMALHQEPTDLNIPRSQFRVINYVDNIGPIVRRKCQSCHSPGYVDDGDFDNPPKAPTPAAGNLDLSDEMETLMRENQTFPRGYVNLSGESMDMDHNVVVPAFPRRSTLIDYVLGVGSHAGQPPHPDGANALTPQERETFNLWVLLGAQYR